MAALGPITSDESGAWGRGPSLWGELVSQGNLILKPQTEDLWGLFSFILHNKPCVPGTDPSSVEASRSVITRVHPGEVKRPASDLGPCWSWMGKAGGPSPLSTGPPGMVTSQGFLEEAGSETGRRVATGGRTPAGSALCLWAHQLGKAYGVESHVLSPAETKALYPLMNVDDLYGTLYVPHDGTMDPAGTCSALARAAAARGAQVWTAPSCRHTEAVCSQNPSSWFLSSSVLNTHIIVEKI